MGTPGVQITEILKVIDRSIKFVIKLKEAPDEIRSILDSVEHAIDLLKALEQRRKTYGDEIETAHLTENAIEKYKAVIAKLEKFIKDHSRLTEGQFRGRLYWIVSEHFRNERESLERDLQKVEDRIGLAINLNTSTQLYRVERSNSLVHTNSQRVHHAPIRQSSMARMSRAEPTAQEWNTQEQYSPSLFADDFQPTPNIANTPEPYNLQRRHTYLSETESEATTHRSSIFTTISSSASIRTSMTSLSQYSPESSPPRSGNIHDMKSWSWNRDSITEVDETTVPIQRSIEAASLASQTPRTSSGYTIQAQQQPPPPASPISLPSPSVDRLNIKGEIKLWYLCEEMCKGQKRYVRSGHPVKVIEIVRQGSCGATEIRIVTDTRRAIFHRGPPENPDISQAIRRIRVSRDFAVSHPPILVQLQVSGSHKLFTRKKDRSSKILFTGSPEYTFTDESDNREFQSKIRGQILISEEAIVSISTPDKRTLSENRYLQLWGETFPRKIRYFCNVGGRNVFEEHEVKSLMRYTSGGLNLKEPDKSRREKNESESDREIEIRVATQNGEKLPYGLKVLFLSRAQMEGWIVKAKGKWVPD